MTIILYQTGENYPAKSNRQEIPAAKPRLQGDETLYSLATVRMCACTCECVCVIVVLYSSFSFLPIKLQLNRRLKSFEYKVICLRETTADMNNRMPVTNLFPCRARLQFVLWLLIVLNTPRTLSSISYII